MPKGLSESRIAELSASTTAVAARWAEDRAHMVELALMDCVLSLLTVEKYPLWDRDDWAGVLMRRAGCSHGREWDEETREKMTTATTREVFA